MQPPLRCQCRRGLGAVSALMDFKELEEAVRKKYPDLRLATQDGKEVFRGGFPIIHDGEEIDRFLIEIRFPDGITKLPLIYEIGGRVPRTMERHVFPQGNICAEVPELTILRGYSLISYLDGPVRNYFIGQGLVEKGEKWPFKEWSHGKEGLLEAYGDLLGVSDEKAIHRYLDCLGHKKIKGHWPCPCGSKNQIRVCHVADIRRLQGVFPPRIAQQALKRIKLHEKPTK